MVYPLPVCDDYAFMRVVTICSICPCIKTDLGKVNTIIIGCLDKVIIAFIQGTIYGLPKSFEIALCLFLK